MKTFKEQLIEMDAYEDIVNWVGDKTLEEAWEQCERGDHMLWIYAKLFPNNKRELTLACGHCANTVRHLMKDQRSRDAVDTVIAFGEGKASEDELLKARENAAEAAAAASVYACVWSAAWSAAYATLSAAAEAAWAAADAAYASASVYASAWAATSVAKKANQKQTADICRKYLRMPVIDKEEK